MKTVKLLVSVLLVALPFVNAVSESANPVITDSTASDLIAADKAFNTRAQEIGVADAFAEFAATDAVMYRNGAEPIQGREAIRTLLAAEVGVTLVWKPLTADIAASGDLGYTRGSFVLSPPSPPDAKTPMGSYKGYYVTIWKKQPDGSWKWVFDSGVVSQLPPPPEENK